MNAVRDLARSCLVEPTLQQTAEAVARAALADACERELQAMAAGGFDRGLPTSTPTPDDVQLLADLEASVQRALNPPPLPPPPPPLTDCTATEPDLSDPSLLLTTDGNGRSASENDSMVLRGQESSMEATSEAQNIGPYSGDNSNDDNASSSVPDQLVAPSSAEGKDASIELTPEEVQHLLEGFPRKRTLLLFRIEKRKILTRCAQLLQPQ